MFYQMLLFDLSNPKNNFNEVFMRNIRSILQTSRKKKNTTDFEFEKRIFFLLIKMPLNRLEYKIQFLERGNYRKFNKI